MLADQSKSVLASFAANFIICDIPTTHIFKEKQVENALQHVQNYLDVKNYRLFENSDRELFGYYTPLYQRNQFIRYNMMKFSRLRYAVVMFLQYVEEKRIQEEFEKLKQHSGI